MFCLNSVFPVLSKALYGFNYDLIISQCVINCHYQTPRFLANVLFNQQLRLILFPGTSDNILETQRGGVATQPPPPSPSKSLSPYLLYIYVGQRSLLKISSPIFQPLNHCLIQAVFLLQCKLDIYFPQPQSEVYSKQFCTILHFGSLNL